MLIKLLAMCSEDLFVITRKKTMGGRLSTNVKFESGLLQSSNFKGYMLSHR